MAAYARGAAEPVISQVCIDAVNIRTVYGDTRMLWHTFLKSTARLVVVPVVVSSGSLVIATDEPFQQRPLVLIASDFLPKSMLSGEG